MRLPIHRGVRHPGGAGSFPPLKTGKRIAIAAVALLFAACVHGESHDEIIARYTREYVAGHVSFRRYRDLCHALNAHGYPSSSGTTTASNSDSSSSSDTTEQDNRHEKEKRDKEHADSHHPSPPPPPSGIVAPQPPPPPSDNR